MIVLNADALDLKAALRGKWPRSAVLAEGTPQAAAIRANELLEAVGDGPENILLLDPADPSKTKLYSRRWLSRSYRFRVPCGEWAKCDNPEGPITAHYAPPGKKAASEPSLCKHCRLRQGPTQRNREVTAQRNRDRAGQPRKRRRES